ncbi:hypothetical protein Tco_1008842 [Tanacetum coccineum]
MAALSNADASSSEYLERASVSDHISVDSRKVKDYVMEWIGSEIKKERPKKDWFTSNDPVSSELDDGSVNVNTQQKKQKKKKSKSDKKNRKPREWWKKEFCDELSKKKKKKKRRGSNAREMWWRGNEMKSLCHEKNRSRVLSDPRLFYGSRFAHSSAHGSAPVDDDDDSPVEEMSPIKAKKTSRRASKAKKNDAQEKELPKD